MDLNIYLKDAFYPELSKQYALPEIPAKFPFDVEGFLPGFYSLDTNEGRAANCYGTVCLGVNNFTKYRDSVSWSRAQRLKIRPMVGQAWNAFYDRKNLNFYFNWDSLRSKNVYTSASPDIVLHELGHALLDAMRPDFWRFSTMFEVWSLHESFGDLFALAGAFSHDEVLKRALEETGGDLRKTNILSRLAEQFGRAMSKIGDDQVCSLRDGANSFIYVDPSSLPKKGKPEELLAEIHSFSRVFTGAIYDFLVGVYEIKRAACDPFTAAKQASEVMLRYLIATAEFVAIRSDFFDSYARCMLFIDYKNGEPYSKLLHEIFAKRNLLHEVKTLEVKPEPIYLYKQTVGKTKRMAVYRESSFVQLSEEPVIRSMSDNPLYSLKVEVTNDRYREFDRIGNLLIDDYSTHQATIDSVGLTLDYLHQEDLVGDRDDQPYGIDGRHLIRKSFCC